MPNANPPSSSRRSSAEPPHALLERVRARVAEAGVAIDRHDRAVRPKVKRPRRSQPAAPAPELGRETRSLRRVFKELGETYRHHRRVTGQQVSPAVRNAAVAFKEAPSLNSLVAVAAYLDEDGLLAW